MTSPDPIGDEMLQEELNELYRSVARKMALKFIPPKFLQIDGAPPIVSRIKRINE